MCVWGEWNEDMNMVIELVYDGRGHGDFLNMVIEYVD